MAKERMDKKGLIISPKEMKEKYPGGGFKVVGKYIQKEPAGDDEVLAVDLGTGPFVRVDNSVEYKRPKFITGGYLPVKDDEYVALLKRNWKRPVITLLVLLAVIGLAVGGYFLWKAKSGPDIDPSIKDYESDLKRPEDLGSAYIAVPGVTEMVVDAGSDLLLGTTLFNPEGNPCFFQYTLVLDEKDEVIYESKLIPPGKGISDIQLNRKIKEGVYDITLKIKTYDLEDYDTQLNGAEVEGKLRALK